MVLRTKQRVQLSLKPLRLTKITRSPKFESTEDPSTNKVHYKTSIEGGPLLGVDSSGLYVNSAMKSVSAYPLIVFLELYWKSNAPNSIVHLASWPKV